MKKNKLIIFSLIALTLIGFNGVTHAQPGTRTNGKMIYHDGPVLTGTRNLYYIFYGCWGGPAPCGYADDQTVMNLLADFAVTVGWSPYLQINSTYPDANGQAPSGGIVLGGLLMDNSYSHGNELTRSDVVSIISEKVNSFQLPQDRNGIYVIFTSPDVSAIEMGFCSPDVPPHHGLGIVNGDLVQYVFLGNPRRCPTVAGAPYFVTGGTPTATPNGTFAGDALVTNLAHALNTSLTNPRGNGWFDRYGLENADKCTNTLGTTYRTSNGGEANVRLGGRDYLLEQNWVNDRKGRCALRR